MEIELITKQSSPWARIIVRGTCNVNDALRRCFRFYCLINFFICSKNSTFTFRLTKFIAFNGKLKRCKCWIYVVWKHCTHGVLFIWTHFNTARTSNICVHQFYKFFNRNCCCVFVNIVAPRAIGHLKQKKMQYTTEPTVSFAVDVCIFESVHGMKSTIRIRDACFRYMINIKLQAFCVCVLFRHFAKWLYLYSTIYSWWILIWNGYNVCCFLCCWFEHILLLSCSLLSLFFSPPPLNVAHSLTFHVLPPRSHYLSLFRPYFSGYPASTL